MGLLGYIFKGCNDEAQQVRDKLYHQIERQERATKAVQSTSDKGKERDRELVTVLDDMITRLEPKNEASS